MGGNIVVQKLKKEVGVDITMAEKYYSILSVINGLKLTQRDIQLVAFTAIRGNISQGNTREEFCKGYNTTVPTINNIISKLRRMQILVREGNKTKVNPVILLDFSLDITLEIKLVHGQC